MIEREELLEILYYYPETGELRWRDGINRLAGKVNSFGYRTVVIRGRYYLAHRLAWLIMKGEWPPEEIDHINGDPLDNRITNLRACTRSENEENRGLHPRNSTGYVGVFRHDQCKSKPFVAAITKGGKKTYLGLFATAEEAAQAYKEAKAKHHPFNPIPREGSV